MSKQPSPEDILRIFEDCGTVTLTEPIKFKPPYSHRAGEWRESGALTGELNVNADGTKRANPLRFQQSGDHYVNMPIQPIEFCHRNKLGFIESCIIKRLCRYKSKNGIDDLLKAKHEIDVLISLEYGDKL